MEGSPSIVLDPSTGAVKQEVFADESDVMIVLKEEFEPDDSLCSNKTDSLPESSVTDVLYISKEGGVCSVVKEELTNTENCCSEDICEMLCSSSNIHTVIKDEIDADVTNSIPTEQLHSNNMRKTMYTTGQCRSEGCLTDVTCMLSTKPIVSEEQEAFGKTRKDVTCDKCSKTFPNLIILKSHILEQCCVKQYQHGVCKKSFSQPSSLPSHKLVHSDIRNKSNESDTCEKNFVREHQLPTHAVVCSDVKNYGRDICNKAFTTTSNLNRHIAIHIKKHICDICNKAFSCSSSMKQHKQIHTVNKTYVCNICNKAFTTLVYLSKHKERHSGIKNYVCNICNKAFATSQSLKNHKERHAGIKNHICDICNKAFTTSHCLKQHRIVHTGIKNHVCNICNEAFIALNSLNRHKQRLHTGIKNYVCNVCNKAFNIVYDLNRHKEAHTGVKNHICDICNKAFTLSRYLKQHHEVVHTVIKNHVCDICNKAFTTLGNLRRHKVRHSA